MPVRIYEIAKKLGIENKEVLTKAKELGITAARVPSSSLDKITAEFLESHLKPLAPPPAPPEPIPPPAPIEIHSAPPPAPPEPKIEIVEAPPPVQFQAPSEAAPEAVEAKAAPVVEPPVAPAPPQ